MCQRHAHLVVAPRSRQTARRRWRQQALLRHGDDGYEQRTLHRICRVLLQTPTLVKDPQRLTHTHTP